MNFYQYLVLVVFATTLIACGGGGGESSPKDESNGIENQTVECITPRNEALDGFDSYGLARLGEYLGNYSNDVNNPVPVIAVDTEEQLKQNGSSGNYPPQEVGVFDFHGYTYHRASAFVGRSVDQLYVYDSANSRSYTVQKKSKIGLKNIDMRRFPIVMNDKLYALSQDSDELYRIEGCEAILVGDLSAGLLNNLTYVVGDNLYMLKTSGGIDGKYRIVHYQEGSGVSLLELSTQTQAVSLEMNKDILTVSDYGGGKVELYSVSEKTLTLLTSFTADLSADIENFKSVSDIYQMNDGKVLLKISVEFDSSVSTNSLYAYVTLDKMNHTVTYSRELPAEYANENLVLSSSYLGGMDFFRDIRSEGGKNYVYKTGGGVFEFAAIKPTLIEDLLTIEVRNLVDKYVVALTVNDQYIVIADIIFDNVSNTNMDNTVKRTELKKYDYHTKTLIDLVTIPAEFNDRTMGSVSYSGFFVSEDEFYFELLDGDNEEIITESNPNRFKVNVETGTFEQLLLQ
jgi:hypothetical protein